MLARICDFCGELIQDDNFYGKISYTYPYTVNDVERNAGNVTTTSGDMCSNCYDQINTYIKNLRIYKVSKSHKDDKK